tara:strand:+ start:337 stop:576 length:240 start_codon:yes stop_codon:yes gene_type:complete
MPAIIKFFLIFLVIYYIIGFLSRLYLVYILNKFKKNAFRQTNNKPNNEKEGDVTIDKMPKNKSKKVDNLGDYVDYEEID